MLLRFNGDKWSLVKMRKIKTEIRLELEDSLEEKIIERIKAKHEDIKTEEDILNYFKNNLFSKETAEDFANSLGAEKATVKEVINISMEEAGE